MKIAIATTDGLQLSPHFGRSAGFVVFQTEGSASTTRELRRNSHTPHAQGLCTGHGHQNDGQNHAGHSHANILDLLKDCETVICGGMGAGAAQALKQQGIRPVILQTACSVDEALQTFLRGDFSDADVLCNCHS